MKVFCFHSVRSKLAIPPACMWPSEELHDQFVYALTVNPEWFYEWLPQAKEVWGPDMIVTFDDAFRDVMVPAITSAKDHSLRTIVFVPTGHIGMVFPYAPYDVMNEEELSFISQMGVELGSHGHYHREWTETSDMVVYNEINISLAIVEALSESNLGEPDRKIAVAPPHAKFTTDHARMVYDCGHGPTMGTHLFPAGTVSGTPEVRSEVRWEAKMEGYLDAEGVAHQWPWER